LVSKRDIERVDVEVVYLGVGVLEPQGHGLAHPGAQLGMAKYVPTRYQRGSGASASALTPAVASDGGMATTRLAPSTNAAIPTTSFPEGCATVKVLDLDPVSLLYSGTDTAPTDLVFLLCALCVLCD
jgi:hypothetical protein